MKGQVTIEELISLAVYLALIAILSSAVFQMKEGAEEWSTKSSLTMEASSLATSADAFCNSGIYNQYQKGKGLGYIEVKEGGSYATAPVLCGFFQEKGGEPV